jgi:hypothetical protein
MDEESRREGVLPGAIQCLSAKEGGIERLPRNLG